MTGEKLDYIMAYDGLVPYMTSGEREYYAKCILGEIIPEFDKERLAEMLYAKNETDKIHEKALRDALR